jgi:hypothetical protein
MPKAVSYLIALLCGAIVICINYSIAVYAVGLCPAKDVVMSCSYTEEYNDCNCPRRSCKSNSGFVVIAQFGLSIVNVNSMDFWNDHAVTPFSANALFNPSYNKNPIHCFYVEPSYDSQTGASSYNCWECRNKEYGCINHQGPIEYYLTNCDYITSAF